MASALVPLANLTLSSSASTLTFSSISGVYRDLMIVATVGVSTAAGAYMRFNGDTASNYYAVWAWGNGSSTGSSSFNFSAIPIAAYGISPSTPAAMFQVSILDYQATDKHKSTLIRNSDSAYAVEMIAGRWASTSAITSILLYPAGGATWAAGSTFALYGVSA